MKNMWFKHSIAGGRRHGSNTNICWKKGRIAKNRWKKNSNMNLKCTGIWWFLTDNKSLAYSSSSGHRSIGRNGGRCGKCSLNIGISVGHWLECGVPINLYQIKSNWVWKYKMCGASAICEANFLEFWFVSAYVNIFSNWFRSDVPGNKAWRENNSAIMQAELHISTALLYDWFNNTSGARYHNVTTCKHAWTNDICVFRVLWIK